MQQHAETATDLAAAMAQASQYARTAVAVTTEREAAIRDTAAGVAAPVLVGFVLWLREQAGIRGFERLRFLSRDGQAAYELASRLASRLGWDTDLEYVHSSRLTWSLAASDPSRLGETRWLFDSFMQSNAADVCARLGLPADEFEPILVRSGASLDPDVRADQPQQLAALQRFVTHPQVARLVAQRITTMRDLVLDYARQHLLDAASTGLVDAGWTGRMIHALFRILSKADLSLPRALLWGHEPRPHDWTDPQRIIAYMYNTAAEPGVRWRVPDAPFLVESLCMSDHGIVAGYQRANDGTVHAVLQSQTNPAAERWGLELYRRTLYEFCAQLDLDHVDHDVRPMIYAIMQAFWLQPSRAEARAWASYPYDSDPAGTAARPLARRFSAREALRALIGGRLDRGDRAWLEGSIALSGALTRPLLTSTVARDDKVPGSLGSARTVQPRANNHSGDSKPVGR